MAARSIGTSTSSSSAASPDPGAADAQLEDAIGQFAGDGAAALVGIGHQQAEGALPEPRLHQDRLAVPILRRRVLRRHPPRQRQQGSELKQRPGRWTCRGADTGHMTKPDGAHEVDPPDAEGVIERLHAAMGAFIHGDARPAVELFTRGDDVTLGNPFGPFARGWDSVAATATQAATNYREGEVVGFERIATYASADLACFVEIERYRAKMGGRDEVSSVALRVSTVVRRDGDGWRIASRHADPITAAQPAESVIAER